MPRKSKQSPKNVKKIIVPKDGKTLAPCPFCGTEFWAVKGTHWHGCHDGACKMRRKRDKWERGEL